MADPLTNWVLIDTLDGPARRDRICGSLAEILAPIWQTMRLCYIGCFVRKLGLCMPLRVAGLIEAMEGISNNEVVGFLGALWKA
jgi:hypothetical protein